MNPSLHVDEGLFSGGPPLGVQKWLRIIRSSGDRRVGQRVLMALVMGWMPLLVLTAIREFSAGIPVMHSFLMDAAVHARSLIAVPLLLIAESDAIPRFGRAACHFLSSGLVSNQDAPRYSIAAESTRGLLNSRIAEIIVFVVSYAIAIPLVLYLREELPAWQRDPSTPLGLSVAGLWHATVSLPLLFTLFLGWFWRILLWWRFLYRMSRLDLNLVPAHPDNCGGLLFLSTSIRGYRLLALAFASVVAGRQLEVILKTGKALSGVQNVVIALLIVVLLLSVGPLLVFTSKMRSAKATGIFMYGALGREVGTEFQRKWLDRDSQLDDSVLQVGDFSTMTDLYQVVGNVYDMREVPFALRSLQHVVVAALVPFVPVALAAVPLKQILITLAKLVV